MNKVITLLLFVQFFVAACGRQPDVSSLRSAGEESESPETSLRASQIKQLTLEVRGDGSRKTTFKQRNKNDLAAIEFKVPNVKFDSAVVGIFKDGKQLGDKVPVKAEKSGYIKVKVPRGMTYHVHLFLNLKGERVAHAVSHRIIVGDIFLVAGQSNSANAGSGLTATRTGAAFMYTGTDWAEARDPFGTADTTTGSSPWPNFGDFYYQKTGVPAAIVSLGWSGTEIKQWLPGDASNLNARNEVIKDAGHILHMSPVGYIKQGGNWDRLCPHEFRDIVKRN